MGKAQRRIAELEARVAYLETQSAQAGQAEFEAECAEAFVRPIDHETDFQEFMAAYDMPTRLTRLMRLAYLCGVADEHVPEM
jgi:hypothetical protein